MSGRQPPFSSRICGDVEIPPCSSLQNEQLSCIFHTSASHLCTPGTKSSISIRTQALLFLWKPLVPASGQTFPHASRTTVIGFSVRVPPPHVRLPDQMPRLRMSPPRNQCAPGIPVPKRGQHAQVSEANSLGVSSIPGPVAEVERTESEGGGDT